MWKEESPINLLLVTNLFQNYYMCNSVQFIIDVKFTLQDICSNLIGHFVERDALKEKEVNGKKSKLIDR